MIVLDTNIVSEGDKPDPSKHVLIWFRSQDPLSLFLCGPVVMELSYGAERYATRTRSDRYLKILRELVSNRFRNRILQFDGIAPSLAGTLRARRDSIGRPISVQDAMIAAICIVHDATLATRNVRDFDGLDLKLVNPFEAGA
jgi:predicted nucleic acid-binding protein